MECIVCCRPVLFSTTAQRKSLLKPEVFDDQLVVIYFFQKFFDVPTLREGAEGCDDSEGDFYTPEGLLRRLGNPVEWANFCSACCSMVRRAKALHYQLTKIEEQLRDLKSKIETEMKKSQLNSGGVVDEPLKDWIRRHLRTRNHGRRNGGEEQQEFVDADLISDVKEDFIYVKLEPMEIEADEIPSSSIDEIHFEDVKMESKESFYELNVDDYIISPSQPSNTLEVDKCRGWKSKTQNAKRIAKPKSKKKTTKKVRKTCAKPAKSKPSSTDEMDSSGRLKEEEVESEPDASNTDDDDDNDEDYSPEPEAPEARPRYVKLPKRRKLKPGTEEKERGYFVICKGPRKARKYVNPVSERTCPICKEVFSRKSLLKGHTNSKHEKKILFNCEICQKGYYTKQSYNQHCKKHLTTEEIKHLILANKLDAVKVDGVLAKDDDDSLDVNDVEETEYSEDIVNKVLERTCPVCKKIYLSKKEMESHMSFVHEKNRPFVCEKCGKSFQAHSQLAVHLRRHEINEREVKCQYPGCTAAFKLSGDLLKHEQVVHLKKFKTVCPQCGKTLGTPSAFRRHILNFHTENLPRNFKCEICPKEFKTNQALAAHLKCRSHGGPGLKKRKWIPKHIRLQMRIDKGLIPPLEPQKTQQSQLP